MHLSRSLVAFALLAFAVIVLAAGSGWRNVVALVLALFALLFALFLGGCGVKSYEAKLMDCTKVPDGGTYALIEECQQTVECEYHTDACGVRWR